MGFNVIKQNVSVKTYIRRSRNLSDRARISFQEFRNSAKQTVDLFCKVSSLVQETSIPLILTRPRGLNSSHSCPLLSPSLPFPRFPFHPPAQTCLDSSTLALPFPPSYGFPYALKLICRCHGHIPSAAPLTLLFLLTRKTMI